MHRALAAAALLLLGPCIPAVAAPAAPEGALLVAEPAAALPEPARDALRRLVAAAQRGDRSAFFGLLPPGARAGGAELADLLVATAERPLSDARAEVLVAAPIDSDWHGILLVSARSPASGEGREAACLEFRTSPRPEAAAPPWLLLEETFPALVRAADLELVLDPAQPRFTVDAKLELESRWPGLRALLLTCPAGDAPRTSTPGATLGVAGAMSGASKRSLLRVDLAAPLGREERVSLHVARTCDFGEGLTVGGSGAYLPMPVAYAPWADGATYTHAVTVDCPAELRSVSLGAMQELPAPKDRRRTRFTCDRPVAHAAVAVARYQVHRERADGGLELWRAREVGGEPAEILGQLRELVAFLEQRLGPLPYADYRLVELPTTSGLATSYPSLIFMTADMLAVKEWRWEILSHEAAHQWFGNAVIPDARSRWIAEGTAEALRDLVVRELRSEEQYRDLQDQHLRKVFAGLGPGVRPLAFAPGGSEAYDRGALGLHALRGVLGDDAFWSVLRAWVTQYSGRRVDTGQLERTASLVASREVDGVFHPWFRTTALPVLTLEWKAQGGREGLIEVAGVIRQEEPHFDLAVPVRITLAGGEAVDAVVPTFGPEAEFTVEVGGTPERVQIDPDQLVPRLLRPEIPTYLRREGAACLARGERARGIALLERARGDGMLPLDLSLQLLAARRAEGLPEAPGLSLEAILAEQPDATARQRALRDAAEGLLEQDAPALALPLVEQLDAEVTDGAVAPALLGATLRRLGREDEARVAYTRALERRPGHAASRAALGLAAPAPGGAGDALAAVLPSKEWDTKASSARRTVALALGRGRLAVLQGGHRRLLAGTKDALAAVPGYAPDAALAAVAVGAGGDEPLVVVLEGDRQRSRLSVFQAGADGRLKKVATHERCPGGLAALATDGQTVRVGRQASGAGWEWFRFTGELKRSSAGRDDRDGLLSLEVAGDSRFERDGESRSREVAFVQGVGLVQADGARVTSAQGPAWEPLDPAGVRVVALAADGDALAVLVGRDASRSPFQEDARLAMELVRVSADGIKSRAVHDASDSVSLAPDGDLALVTDAGSCAPEVGVRFGTW